MISIFHLFRPLSSSPYLNVVTAKQPDPAVNLQKVNALANVREVQVLLQKVVGFAPAQVVGSCSRVFPTKLANA